MKGNFGIVAATQRAEALPEHVQSKILKNQRMLIRLIHVTVATAMLLILFLSFLLKPDSRGLGTHEQLMLRPCSFHALTGLPCPSCGMTTAFAHMAHGQFRKAFIAQPLGALGFLLCVILLPIVLFAAIADRNLLEISERVPWKMVMWALGTLFVLAWLFKLYMFLIA